jgi:hypothetical protein
MTPATKPIKIIQRMVIMASFLGKLKRLGLLKPASWNQKARIVFNTQGMRNEPKRCDHPKGRPLIIGRRSDAFPNANTSAGADHRPDGRFK